MKKALLLSGGIDSTAIAYWLKTEIELAITIDYGQKGALSEISASTQICEKLQLRHEIITVDCKHLGSGNMVNANVLSVAPTNEWWPYRNQLLITLACMKIISQQFNVLLIGSVESDGNHRDGTAAFYENLNKLLSVQEGNLTVLAPALSLSTLELVARSGIPADLLFWAHSCHTSNEPCGSCNGCKKYMFTMQQLGFD